MSNEQQDSDEQPQKPKRKATARKPSAKKKKSPATKKAAKKKKLHHGAVKAESRRKQYLRAYARWGIVTRALKEIGLTRTWLKWNRDRFPEFDQQCTEALQEATERLEEEARRRAFDGTKRPVFFKGQKCGYIQEYSDSLLMFLLKGRKPEVYRENATVLHGGQMGVNHSGQVAVTVTIQQAVEAMEAKYGADLEALARSRLGVAVPGLSGAGHDGAVSLSAVHGATARGSNGHSGNGHHQGTNGSNGNGHH